MTNEAILTYVITGATSFIGSKIVKDLLWSGNKVIALCRPNSSKLQNLPLHDNLQIIEIDIEDINILVRLIKADIFINLAWKGTNHEERNNTEINQLNVGNTIAAMKVAKEIGCRLFVETGSQAEYGYMQNPVKETSPLHPFTAYGKAKREVLNKCSDLAKQINIAYLHLRIFSVYGEGDHGYTLFKTCLSKMIVNEDIELTAGIQKWNFLYIDDAASIIITLAKKVFKNLKSGETEIVNVASKDTRCLCEYISIMKFIMESKSVLNFGSLQSDKLLSIIPDTTKLFSILGKDFPLLSFSEGIKTTLIRLESNLRE